LLKINICIFLWKYFARQIYSCSFHISKLNDLKVIHDLFPMFDSNHVQNDFTYQTGGSTWILLLVSSSWKNGVIIFGSLFSKVIFCFPLRYMHMPFWYVAFISYLFQQFLNLLGLLLSKHDISISWLSDFFCRSSKIHLSSTSYIPVKHQAYLYEVAISSRLQPPHNVIENIVVSVSSKQFSAVLPKNLLAKIFHFIHKNLRWCQYSFKWEKLKFFLGT
jgi:hypothetical protein